MAVAESHNIAAEIKRKAIELGFDLAGIASAEPSQYRDYFRQWLDDGRHGSMSWMAARFAERTDPAVYMPGAKSVICVAMNHFVPLKVGSAQRTTKSNDVRPATNGPQCGPYGESSNSGRIARYALGDDYHEIIKPRLHALADWLHTIAPDAETRCAVDTAPIMEKELAARTGVGWLGKNTCIINEDIGSWLLLGEILTTLDVPPDAPATDRCGTCTRCLDSCPTQAITAPYQLDASKCISYLTIEHRGDIPPALQAKMGDWIYGCDVCQDVCPWNRRAVAAIEPRLTPRFETGTIDLAELESWTAEDYQRELRHSAMKRVKLPVLQRNARIAAAHGD